MADPVGAVVIFACVALDLGFSNTWLPVNLAVIVEKASWEVPSDPDLAETVPSNIKEIKIPIANDDDMAIIVNLPLIPALSCFISSPRIVVVQSSCKANKPVVQRPRLLFVSVGRDLLESL